MFYYKLSRFVSHFGHSLDSGHYIALYNWCCASARRWIFYSGCDDLDIKSLSLSKSLIIDWNNRRNAYIAIYDRFKPLFQAALLPIVQLLQNDTGISVFHNKYCKQENNKISARYNTFFVLVCCLVATDILYYLHQHYQWKQSVLLICQVQKCSLVNCHHL